MSGTFDTLAATRRLETAGMDRQLAEAVAGVVRDGQGQLATSAQVDNLRDDIRNLRRETHSGFSTLRWIVGVNFAMTMAALAAILAHAL